MLEDRTLLHGELKMIKIRKNVFTTTVIFTLFIPLLSCTSSRIKDYISRGNDIQAIELLSSELSKKSDDQEYADLFNQIYPNAIEERYPQKTIDEIIWENISPYGSNKENALKNIVMEVSPQGKILKHKAITKTVMQSENAILKLHEVELIQKFVKRMPDYIGNSKKGVVTQVYKYTEDFSSMYLEAKESFADFYYELGEACASEYSISRLEEAYSIFEKANSYSKCINNVDSKLSETAYCLGEKYQKLGAIENLKTALKWYDKSLKWTKPYKDAGKKSLEINYLIGMELLPDAKNISDYEKVLSYFESAGTFNDAQEKSKEVMYILAKMYRGQKGHSSYEKAGQYFSKLGNYKDAENEAKLYDFYLSLSTLRRNDSSYGIKLNTSNIRKNVYTSVVENSCTPYTYVSTNFETSRFKVFEKNSDSDLYPGMLIRGNSITTQQFSEITEGTRNPISYSLKSDRFSISDCVIQNPASGKVSYEIKNKINQYLSNLIPETVFEYCEVYSPESLELAMGFGYGKNKFYFDRGIFYGNDNVLLVKITQKYFTAQIDEPELPVNFFDPNGILPSKASIGNVSPFYVSSVDYGRSAYFIITSELSTKELINDIENIKPKGNKNYYNLLTPQTIMKWARTHTYVSAVIPGENNNIIRNIEGLYTWMSRSQYSGIPVQDMQAVSFTLKCLWNNDFAVLSDTNRIQIRNPHFVPPHNNNGTGGIPNGGTTSGGTGGIPNGGTTSSGTGGIPNGATNTGSTSGIPNGNSGTSGTGGIPNGAK